MSVEVIFNHMPAVEALVPQQLGEVIRASAGRIAEAAKAAVPVDSGALEGSLLAEPVPGQAGAWQAVAGRDLPDAHAVYAEYGTGGRGEASQFEGKPSGIAYQSGWPGMRAQPYMTPAAEAEKAVLGSEAAPVVVAAIEEACR